MYAQKLRDPRWQRKRLEILSRDDFTCQECKATDKTLHVHHRFYKKGLEPWEYDKALVTLCEDCHSDTTEILETMREVVGMLTINELSKLAEWLMENTEYFKS